MCMKIKNVLMIFTLDIVVLLPAVNVEFVCPNVSYVFLCLQFVVVCFYFWKFVQFIYSRPFHSSVGSSFCLSNCDVGIVLL